MGIKTGKYTLLMTTPVTESKKLNMYSSLIRDLSTMWTLTVFDVKFYGLAFLLFSFVDFLSEILNTLPCVIIYCIHLCVNLELKQRFKAHSDRAAAAASASVASLPSKIQMGPRAIPSVIASDAAVTAAWSEWHKYKSM